MISDKPRIAIGAAIIQYGKLLLVKKNETWILPGGKPQGNESDLECLIRGVKEELSGTRLENFRWYDSFQGITPHKGDLLTAKVWFANIVGQLNSPSSEIKDARYISDFEKYPLSDITFKIVQSLKRDEYL